MERRFEVVKGSEPRSRLESLSDDDLMLLAREGLQAAFELLVMRYQGTVLGVACRFLNDRQLAREVTQDVFLSLWSERDRFEARGKFKGYLLTRTYHRCQLAARSRRNQRKKAEAFGQQDRHEQKPEATPIDTLLASARARELHEQLTTLSPDIRQALILRYLSDLSLEEVAAALDKPVGTIKSHVFRGLRRLHDWAAKVEEGR